jgi:RIO kinase 3
VWVIDVSQSIENIDTMSLEFLYRDCKNVSKFFTSKHLDNVSTPEELFNEVANKNFTGEGFEFISQVSLRLV